MKTQKFSGDYQEIGKQLGEVYRKNRFNIKNLKIDTKLYKNQLAVYQKHYPEFLRELEAAAESGGFNKKRFLYSFIGEYLFWTLDNSNPSSEEKCSIFGVKVGEELFVGRNYDWVPVTEKIFKIYRYNFINSDANSYISISDMNIEGDAEFDSKFHKYLPIDAINDKGLFVGLTFAFNKNWSYGVGSTHMIKLIAETCSTVSDAIKVFEKVPLCVAKNFFIADKNGDMVVVEHIAKKNFKVIYPKDDILIKTNHFLDPKMTGKDNVMKERPYHTTFLRYFEILREIHICKKRFKISDIIDILGDKVFYTRQDLPGMRTIWTLAMNITKQDYRLYWNFFGKRKEQKIK